MIAQAKPENHAKSDKLFGEASKFNKGDILPHELIESCIGCKRHEGSYGSIFTRFRKRMRRERGVTLHPINGVGFKLLTDEEVVRIMPKLRRKKMYRQSSKCMAELSVVDQTHLTMHQRTALANSIELLEKERTQLRSHRIATSSLLRTPHTLPRHRDETTPQETQQVVAQAGQ